VGTSGACRLANLTRLDAHSDDAPEERAFALRKR
jgi:hypothetical protein